MIPSVKLTAAGAALLAKVPAGSGAPVTRWQIGTGVLPAGTDLTARTALAEPLKDLPIARVTNSGRQSLVLGQFVNAGMDAFDWEELGLLAQDPDEGEILMGYGCAFGAGEAIQAGEDQLREFVFGCQLIFSGETAVAAEIDRTLVFATLKDLENYYTKGETLSPETVYGGKETEISWTAASDPDGNLSGYILERQTNGGSWSQRYKGSGQSYADTVPFGTESVRYRVKAYDGENLSSGYTTSPTRSVVNAPDVPVLTVPELAMEGQTVPVSWTAATHATGYTLERKASTDADWTQVYSGQALSFSETAGAWSWVQYRVKATGEKADSAWAVSGEIPVVSASALVISGQDGDLGTLVNDVPYSVSSDTGNQISLELRVNGALWTALEVSSGYAQSIPVIDLPTGEGTIDILATVQASTGAVSAARAWTYTKTPVTTSAGLCDVVEWQDAAGAVKFPITLAEAVRIPGGKTLDQVTQFPAQICTGSYVGTGTYGKDNPNTITLPFNAEIIWIGYAFNSTNAQTSAQRGAFSFMRGSSHGLSYIANQSSMSAIKISFEENTCSWFANTAIDQLNLADTTYRYVALGAFMDGDDE